MAWAAACWRAAALGPCKARANIVRIIHNAANFAALIMTKAAMPDVATAVALHQTAITWRTAYPCVPGSPSTSCRSILGAPCPVACCAVRQDAACSTQRLHRVKDQRIRDVNSSQDSPEGCKAGSTAHRLGIPAAGHGQPPAASATSSGTAQGCLFSPETCEAAAQMPAPAAWIASCCECSL